MRVLAKSDGLVSSFRRVLLFAWVLLCPAMLLTASTDLEQVDSDIAASQPAPRSPELDVSELEPPAPTEHLRRTADEYDEDASHALFLIVAVACATLLLGCTWTALHMPVEQAEHQFWLRLLAPVSNLEGLDLVRAVDGICAQWHDYPDRGRIHVSKEQAFFWMGVLKLTDSASLRRERTRARVEGQCCQAQQAAKTRQAENDLFWMHLLAPLLHHSDGDAREMLANLVGKPHTHPHDGVQTYDAPTLNERWLWARSTSPEDVVARWRQAHAPDNGFRRPIAETDAPLLDMVRGARADGWSSSASRRVERRLTSTS